MRNDIQIWVLSQCRDMDRSGLSKRKPPKIDVNLPRMLAWIGDAGDEDLQDLAFNVLKRQANLLSPKTRIDELLQKADEDLILLTPKPPAPEKPQPEPRPKAKAQAKRKARTISKKSPAKKD